MKLEKIVGGKTPSLDEKKNAESGFRKWTMFFCVLFSTGFFETPIRASMATCLLLPVLERYNLSDD
jgi:hypothetical protein